MKIAVTGSSGLIGRAACEHLESQGHEIIKLVRDAKSANGPHACLWNAETGSLENDKLQGLHACLHLAGRGISDHRWTEHEKELIRSSRIDATRRLCHSLKSIEPRIQTFVCASAVGIYGDCGEQIVDEETGPGQGFLADTAVAWEAAADTLESIGVRVCHARFGVVLSKRGGALAKMLPIFRMGLGGNLGSGQQYWPWVALSDVVSALTAMLVDSQYRGPYNVVAPSAVTNAQFTQALTKALHRWRFLPAPKFALRMMLGQMADEALLASCHAVPKRLLQSGFQFEFPELDFDRLLAENI